MTQNQDSLESLQRTCMQFMHASQNMLQAINTYLNSPASSMVGTFASEASRPQDELYELQISMMRDQMRLWHSMLKKQDGEEANFETTPDCGDRRFQAPEWSENPFYDYVRQTYLLNSEYMAKVAEILPARDEKERQKFRFSARQIIEASSPSNFAATNPEFVKTAIESEGRSITEGMQNMLSDLARGRISITDETAFEVGKNLATTRGGVVYENNLMQLIQYSPSTAKVGKRPLLFVPPCINKYYIMDLQPDNSLVKFTVDQGHTLFLISWKNAQIEDANLSWDDYAEGGTITAIRVVQEICETKELNALGFCVGGTILASSLAVLAARGETPVKSLTLMTTLLDFSNAGEISLFIDEKSLASREATIGQGGILTGQELSSTFSALRANDLIWNYVTNNYLKGKKPPAFDLLYWNNDSTNLPGKFAVWYMRNIYQDNSLRVPNKLSVCGSPVDLGRLKMPTYILATREDHIVPWEGSYLSVKLLGGKKRFVLGASGHIAGAINPAHKNKRSYWLNPNTRLGASKWLEKAVEHPGSWWLDWAAWLEAHKGGEQNAPKKPGSSKYKSIEPAPGRYVMQKA